MNTGLEPSCELVDAPDAGEVLGREQNPQLLGLLQVVREECDAGLVEARLSLVHAGLVEPKCWHRCPLVDHQPPNRLALDIEELEEHRREEHGPQAVKQRQRKDKRLGKEPEEDKEDRPRHNHAHDAALELGRTAQAAMNNGAEERVLLQAIQRSCRSEGLLPCGDPAPSCSGLPPSGDW